MLRSLPTLPPDAELNPAVHSSVAIFYLLENVVNKRPVATALLPIPTSYTVPQN